MEMLNTINLACILQKNINFALDFEKYKIHD